MEKRKETLRNIHSREALLWVLIGICLLWMLSSIPPDERWGRGWFLLFLTLFICCIRKKREKQ